MRVTPSSDELIEFIDRQLESISNSLTIEEVSKRKQIAITREAYKACGKDPARYRPSAEALTRRIVNGKGLYRVNNVVDALNLSSVLSGFSIGGFDLGHQEGDVELGIGREGEPYEAIGRGELNIAGLPCLRDAKSAFGTPTSDSARTMVRETTKKFQLIWYDFGCSDELQAAMEFSAETMRRFDIATDIRFDFVKD